MDKGNLENLKHFDEDEVNIRRDYFLADPNLYVYKKYPYLQEAEVIKVPKNSRSVLDMCGVRLRQQLDNGKQTYWFVCLLGKCFHEREVIKLSKSSTANGTTHLSTKHNILASKTAAHQRNVATLRKHIEGADETFQRDPTRWFEVNISAFACENSLSFKAFESSSWKLIANKLPVL